MGKSYMYIICVYVIGMHKYIYIYAHLFLQEYTCPYLCIYACNLHMYTYYLGNRNCNTYNYTGNAVFSTLILEPKPRTPELQNKY